MDETLLPQRARKHVSTARISSGARGSVVRRTRTLAFCQSEVHDDEGQLVARGSATCSIFKQP